MQVMIALQQKMKVLKMKNKFIKILLFAFVLTNAALAQEGTRPLTSNINYLYGDLKPVSFKNEKASTAKTSAVSISIPFFDDFYYACKSAYPSQNYWSDSTVYVNTGMAKAPLSIGVATFDGLNKKGFPYDPNTSFTASNANNADTLTSQPINLYTVGSLTLQPSDSIALLFYYQKTGNGDSPEVQDSLMVDFFKPMQNKWENRVWALRGNTTPNNVDTILKRAFVWVTDTAYFHDGFKFRFRNKAGTNGNYDNWNIDYVYLDKNRSIINDTLWNDLSIGYVPTPFLKNYSAMPWNQYQDFEMATKYSNYIRFNGTTTVNTTYEYKIYDSNNNFINGVSYGASNLPPFYSGGWQHNLAHANPAINYTFAPLTDSTDFTIKHYMMNLAGDLNINNDTVFQFQKFRNYFAYDDGSAETGYYILGTGGRMAYKYKLNVTDTLRALRIYFDPAGSISLSQSYNFRINVFQSGSSGPGTIILKDSLMNPKYSTSGHNQFAEYKLTSPLVLGPGYYYIGFQQFVASGITVGIDRNYDFSSNLYYDSGNGWTQSSVKGAVLMRPVFGKYIEPPVGINESVLSENKIKFYPNPAANYFYLINQSETENLNYQVFSIDGKELQSGNLSQKQSVINTEGLKNGMYFIFVKNSNGTVLYQNKILIQQ